MKTLFVGQTSIHLKSVGSTNSYASELLRQNRPNEGTLVYTFEQTKGRGQRGSVWESEPNKNVALSLVLYPTFLQLDKQFLFNKITSLAVADLMAELLGVSDDEHRIKIKWPNDIYVNDKKISGILIENTLRDSSIQSAIVGVGINVNQLLFSSDINATSLALLANKEFNLMSVLERLCELIEAGYLQLKANKLESIDNAYTERLYQLNEWHSYISDGQHFEGKIIGTSDLGKLQIQLNTSQVKEFDLKKIEFVRTAKP